MRRPSIFRKIRREKTSCKPQEEEAPNHVREPRKDRVKRAFAILFIFAYFLAKSCLPVTTAIRRVTTRLPGKSRRKWQWSLVEIENWLLRRVDAITVMSFPYAIPRCVSRLSLSLFFSQSKPQSKRGERERGTAHRRATKFPSTTTLPAYRAIIIDPNTKIIIRTPFYVSSGRGSGLSSATRRGDLSRERGRANKSVRREEGRSNFPRL